MSRRLFVLELMPKGSTCAEIGVWQGDFSKTILKVTKPKELHLIDPWTYEPNYPKMFLWGFKEGGTQGKMDEMYNSVVSKFKDKKNVVIHRGNSQNVMREFTNNFFDWVYIDDNHRYEFVKNDLIKSFYKVKNSGFISGDDYDWGNDDVSQNKHVKDAVDEFITEFSVEKVVVKNSQYILKVVK